MAEGLAAVSDGTYLESRGLFPGRAAVKTVTQKNQHKEENSNMRRKLLAGLLACVMLFSLLPATALAEGETAVARIGESLYETLDDAVKAAEDDNTTTTTTIELLADAETEGLDLRKNLTIQAAEGVTAPTVTFTKYGIALWGTSLTFQNVNVVMTGIGSTPYTAEWDWMTVCASKDASLTLENTTMTMDGTGTEESETKTHAIYFCSNNKLNLTDSTLIIKNYKQDALEWDGGYSGYNVNITKSTFISDHNRSGLTGTFCAAIQNSEVKVINSTGNGSNGSHFDIQNSEVHFDNNGAHGLSAGSLSISKSNVTACGNGANGIHVSGNLSIADGSDVTIRDNACSISSKWTIPGALYIGGESSIADSTVTITDNRGSGIYQKAGTLTVSDSADMTVVRNTAEKLGYGGGIYANGAVSLPDHIQLYNNHAGTAGDDIYNCGTISFGRVGSEWMLDGVPDHCADPIDGWYDDSEEDGRWEAHDKETLHVREFTQFGTQPKALKAAHGVLPDPGPEPVIPAWETSKSKTATNLEKNAAGDYTSEVTLSLPSAEEQLVSDVVLVLDKSSSAKAEEQARTMLESLKDRLEETQAKIRVGVVSFNTRASIANDGKFFDLATEYDAIAAALPKGSTVRGTNTHAGLLAGKAMLDEDTTVDNSRKYLIFVSDAITYMYGAEPTATAWSYPDGSTWMTVATPKNWEKKYGSDAAPADWDTWMTGIGEKVESQGTAYDYPYGGTVVKSTPHEEDWNTAYANSVDTALYLTARTYQASKEEGCHCYAVKAESTKKYAWSDSFMDYLAGGEEVSFDDIRNDIYDLLGAGSRVVDVIGKGTYGTADRFAYDFDFVKDPDCLTLTVNGEELGVTDLTDPDLFMSDPKETARYGFGALDQNIPGAYPFVLHYYAEGQDGQSDECFVWDINVPVSNFEKVQLTYTVKLTNPQLEAGVYGEYDADGLDDETGKQLAGNEYLFTNKRATLYPVDSNGNEVKYENFSRPAVSYEVTTEPTGTLYVTKYVLGGKAGSEQDAEQTFPIQVAVGDVEESFALSTGETKALSGLTVGAKYTVQETDVPGYTANYFHETGTITGSKTGDTAVIVNVPQNECALFISKTVKNSSTDAKFSFTVELTSEKEPVGGTLLYTDSDAAPAEFTSGGTVELASGHSAVIYGLPAGTAYKVTEAASANYTVSSVTTGVAGTDNDAVAEGAIEGGTVKGVHYTNTYTAPSTPGGGGGSSGSSGGSSGGSGGSSGGGSHLNTDDHYSYIIGYKDGTLQPYGSITRGEVATIFFRMLTDETREKYWSQTSGYSDCGPDLWCNNAISTLTNMGIIDGYQDGTFRPYGKITRAQFAKMAVGFFETTREAYQGYFTDVPEEAWYTDYVEAAARVGLVQGFDNGTFQPDTNITRAQACVIVNRALDRKPQKDRLLPESQMVTWPDCKPGDWYYADMQEATNSHDYKWLASGSDKKYLENWTKKLPQRDWAAFEHAWATAHSAPGGEVVK